MLLKRQEEWQTIYIDPKTSEEWVLYPLWEYHGPGPNCLRRGTPTLSELLSCIQESQDDAEVSAAAFHLANELVGGRENYQPLLDCLELMTSNCSNERILRNVGLAIAWSRIEHPFNSRPIIGKSADQIKTDYEHFVGIANRASALKAKVEAVLGYSISQKSTSFQ